MNSDRRRRSADRAHSRSGAAIPQLPLQRVRNPYPPMALLSADQIEAIHEASLHILENFGIEVMSPRALALFEKAGAKVDHATQTVRLDRGLVDEALKTTPSAYTLTPRNPGTDHPSRRRHDQLHAGRRAAQRARHGARPARRQPCATTATSCGWRSISTASTCSATRSARRSRCRPIRAISTPISPTSR